MCFAKRNPRARSSVRFAELSVFLRKHIRLGDEFDAEMERSGRDNERKDGLGHSECRADLHEVGQVFFHQLCGERQDVPDAVPSVAERPFGPADDGSGNVAVGGCFSCFVQILFLLGEKSESLFKKIAYTEWLINVLFS